MADVRPPHASVGIVVTEDNRVVGNQFNAELQLAATREMYKWMADISNCVNDLASIIDRIEQRLTDGGL